MNDDTLSRFDTIRRKIAAKDDMFLGPYLSEEQIQAFEEENSIRLPQEYRQFLQVVGDGVSNAPDRVTGHFNEILALFDTEPDGELLEEGYPMPQALSEPFSLTEPVWYDEDGWPEEDDHTGDGWLSVCPIGCGDEWILIVTGPERGNMWAMGENFYTPSSPRIGFLEWCEQWIERGFDDSLYDLMAGRNGPAEGEEDTD